MQNLKEYIPVNFKDIKNTQDIIPTIAKNKDFIHEVELAVQRIPTRHKFFNADARKIEFLQPESVHLIVTSPPYWNLKKYHDHQNQLGDINDYRKFLDELDKVWEMCYNALVPGGRLICIVGDVLLSRRRNNGVHSVLPLHASIQERCINIGFKNLTPIFWHKISNINFEVNNGTSFLGKPYEPNGIIKSDIEFILMQRKAGGYRKPDFETRILSIISKENHRNWFQQIWSDIPGASNKWHPAPYPVELIERLIRMFSFVGDTVLDPFWGTGTTSIAAAKWGRNSIGIEVDPVYFQNAINRFSSSTNDLFQKVSYQVIHSEKKHGKLAEIK